MGITDLNTEEGICKLHYSHATMILKITALKETTGLTFFTHGRSTSLTLWPFCRLSRDTPVSQALHLSIDAFTGTPPVTDWKRPPGRPRRTWLQQVEEDMGLPITSVPVSSQPWTARCTCGDRCTTLSRSSAAVSE